jgi:hypothetical protein
MGKTLAAEMMIKESGLGSQGSGQKAQQLPGGGGSLPWTLEAPSLVK